MTRARERANDQLDESAGRSIWPEMFAATALMVFGYAHMIFATARWIARHL